MAEGEWFMFVDDDDWFAEPEELIRFFQSGEYKEYGYAHHIYKNFYDPELKTFDYAWITRLSKRWPDLAFHGKVHEYMVPRKGKCKRLHAISYHSGYIFETIETRRRHFERNSKLLEEMEVEEPNELRWKMQLLQEYAGLGKYEELWSMYIELFVGKSNRSIDM